MWNAIVRHRLGGMPVPKIEVLPGKLTLRLPQYAAIAAMYPTVTRIVYGDRTRDTERTDCRALLILMHGRPVSHSHISVSRFWFQGDMTHGIL